MNKKIQFELEYTSDMTDEVKFNDMCIFKTMSLFSGIPLKGLTKRTGDQINYTIKKIAVK